MIGMLPLLALTDDFFPAFDISMIPKRLWPVVLVACCASVIVGSIIGCEISIRLVCTGALQLYSDYAILCYGRKTVQLKKNEFRIIEGAYYTKFSFGRPQKNWTIRFDGHDAYFEEAYQRKANGGGRYDSSLGKAMAELYASGLPILEQGAAR